MHGVTAATKGRFVSTPSRSSKGMPRGPLGRAAYSVAGYATYALAACFAVLALGLIAGTVGYVLQQWVGAFIGLGSALTFVAVALFAVGYRLTLPAHTVAEDGAEPCDSDATGSPSASGLADEPRARSDEARPIAKTSQLLPVAALVLGAASVLGPRRMLRIGIRLYTMWSTTRSILEQTRSGERRQ